MFETIVNSINDFLYGYILIALLLIGGLYFSIRTKFAQFRLLKEQFRCVGEKPKDKQGVSSFQALMVSTASRVGTGNIIGVTSAICLGGYGAVFWMWVIALIGGASALIESTLAQIFKRKGKDGYYGGPAYYIEAIFKRPVAIVFCICLILTYAFGFNMLASFNLQDSFSTYDFYNPEITPWIIGGIVAVLVGICLLGKGKKLVKVTEFLVPIMGVAYIVVALLVILLNIPVLPAVFAEIFRSAFDFGAIFGGLAGSCLMLGIKRGLFSNEAGVGSAPNASASADVSHPVKQGLVQVLSVFIDTILICSATAFMIMCSGVDAGELAVGGSYAPVVQGALHSVFGDAGTVFITVAMVLFAFTTLLGNLYYVDNAFAYILGKEPSDTFKTVYKLVFCVVILVGAVLSSSLLWGIADVLMGIMVLINIPVLICLCKYAVRAIKDYDAKRKSGDVKFRVKDIDLPYQVECWHDEQSK